MHLSTVICNVRRSYTLRSRDLWRIGAKDASIFTHFFGQNHKSWRRRRRRHLMRLPVVLRSERASKKEKEGKREKAKEIEENWLISRGENQSSHPCSERVRQPALNWWMLPSNASATYIARFCFWFIADNPSATNDTCSARLSPACLEELCRCATAQRAQCADGSSRNRMAAGRSSFWVSWFYWKVE
jgi:hypothetical protein